MKRQYVLWAWKGDYLNLGAGCEMGFYNTYGSTKHCFFVQKIFTKLQMKYDSRLINTYKPQNLFGKKKHYWWITTFDAGRQGNVDPSKIGFRCVADLSVLDSSVQDRLIERVEDLSEGRWKIKVKKIEKKDSTVKEKKKAIFKWNYK